MLTLLTACNSVETGPLEFESRQNYKQELETYILNTHQVVDTFVYIAEDRHVGVSAEFIEHKHESELQEIALDIIKKVKRSVNPTEISITLETEGELRISIRILEKELKETNFDNVNFHELETISSSYLYLE